RTGFQPVAYRLSRQAGSLSYELWQTESLPYGRWPSTHPAQSAASRGKVCGSIAIRRAGLGEASDDSGYELSTAPRTITEATLAMAKPASYDAVVIGGGHNGLVCAAYLAKAGKKVCVLERRHVLGGCATTEELWPGYKVSTAAYVISLFLPEIISDLKLKSHGLNILPRNPSSFTPLPDGRSLLLGPDKELCHREISKFSTRDADAYPQYESLLERVAGILEPVLSQTAPDPLPLPGEWRKANFAKKMRDTKKLWSLYQAMASLGESLPEAVELLTGAARPILDRWFESDALKATL